MVLYNNIVKIPKNLWIGYMLNATFLLAYKELAFNFHLHIRYIYVGRNFIINK